MAITLHFSLVLQNEERIGCASILKSSGKLKLLELQIRLATSHLRKCLWLLEARIYSPAGNPVSAVLNVFSWQSYGGQWFATIQ
jgi:hypothetical protein